MRLEKLRQADLNLLIMFAAIAEEKSITAAASRLFLSQPAVSRALQRARAMFQDDLLVRSPNGFELTLRGRKILDELEGLLPRMENLVAPALFDPMREKSHFRISGPDNVCTVVLPRLCRQYANGRYQVQFEFLPWQSGITELVEHGQLDLGLHIDDGLLPSHFQSERLYKEDWICAVARESRFGDRLPLSGQTTGGCRCKTQLLYSGALLRRGTAMPSRHRTGPYPNQRHDISYHKRSQVAAREGTARIARVSFPHGLASKTQQRSASCVASRGRAINSRSQRVTVRIAGTNELTFLTFPIARPDPRLRVPTPVS
jgi:DNA-binding transcriptional LysR family regulator